MSKGSLLKFGDRYDRNEQLTYLSAWLVFLSIPWITELYWSRGFESWRALHANLHMLPYIGIFLLNDLVLMPCLFAPRRKAAYSVAVLAVMVGVWFGIKPPPAPPFMPVEMIAFSDHMFRMINVAFATCVIFANIAIKMYFVSHRKDIEMLEVKNAQMKSELESLKYQINPHFLMNTLNNIQSLIETDPDKAYHTIQGLSRMMRYVLYENSGQMVTLRREIEFMRNYIALMRIRYPENVVITFTHPEDTGSVEVPPLLFITFVENAFKHGISYKGESRVAIEFRITDGRLLFSCLNTNPGKKAAAPGGIGLENVKRRLELTYGENYRIRIEDRESLYLVEVDLPAQ